MVKPACTESPKYKGVRKRKWGKWVSEVRLPNSRERIWLGSFESPEKAARAFDAAQYCLRGSNGNYNFPENPPVIPGARSLTPQEIQAVAFRFANESTNDNNNNGNTSNNENTNNVGTTEQYTSSSSVSDAMQVETERHDETTMDWSFLSMLDTDQAMSDYGFYGDHFYPPLPPPPVDDEYQNGEGDVFSQQSSFLWNF